MEKIRQKFNNSKVSDKLKTMSRSMILMLLVLGISSVLGAFERRTSNPPSSNA